MFAKGRKKDTVKFSISPSNGAKKVFIAGDFTEWEPVRMRKQKDGSYSLTLTMSSGEYQYKFQVDDDWLLDPDNQSSAVNSFGTLNSVAKI
ncbi:MAG: glycogen-binding domain-containing protein [Sedimentisphaerales bacterium]|nr:glycogen-binding domain-containing protein [Sedimentisphaerales bacterium]